MLNDLGLDLLKKSVETSAPRSLRFFAPLAKALVTAKIEAGIGKSGEILHHFTKTTGKS